jgi:hypothetical protein
MESDDNTHEEEDWSVSGGILEPQVQQIDEEEVGCINADVSLHSLDCLYDIPQDSGSEAPVSNALI